MSPDDLRALIEMARLCTDFMRQGMTMGGGMMGRGGMMPMVWWWPFQAFLFWSVLAAVVAVIVLLVRRGGGAAEALKALQLRLARGEISAQEYEQARRLLQT